MLGFFFCEECGETHDDWFHGDRFIICNRCKSRGSVRYKEPIKWFVSNDKEMISWAMNPYFYDLIRKKVTCNPFDIIEVRRLCNRPPELLVFLFKDVDAYIKFAYFDFEDPNEVYKRIIIEESMSDKKV